MDTLAGQGLRLNDSNRNSNVEGVSKRKLHIRAKDAPNHQNKENKGNRAEFVQFDPNIVEINSWSPGDSKILKWGAIEQLLTPEDDVKRRLLAGRTPFQSKTISTIKENNVGGVTYNYELSENKKNSGITSLDTYLAFSPSSTVRKIVAVSSEIGISTNSSLVGSIRSLACSTGTAKLAPFSNHTALESPSSDCSVASQERGRPITATLDTVSNSKPLRRATSEPPSSRPTSDANYLDAQYFSKPKLSLFEGQGISPSESLTDSNASVSRFRPASMLMETFASDVNSEYNFDRGLTLNANRGSSTLGLTPYIVKPGDLTSHVVEAELSTSTPENHLLLSSKILFAAAPTDPIHSDEVGIAYAAAAARTDNADVVNHLRSREESEMDDSGSVEAMRVKPRVGGKQIQGTIDTHSPRLHGVPPRSDFIATEGWDSPVYRVSKHQLQHRQGPIERDNLGGEGVSLLRPPLVSRRKSNHRQRSVSCDSKLSRRLHHSIAADAVQAHEPGPESSERNSGLTFCHITESPPLNQLVPVIATGESSAPSNDVTSIPTMRVMHTSPLQALKGDTNVPRVDWKQQQHFQLHIVKAPTRSAAPPKIAQSAGIAQVSASSTTQQCSHSRSVTPSDSNSSVPAFKGIPDVDGDDDSSCECVRELGLDDILSRPSSARVVEATATIQRSAMSPHYHLKRSTIIINGSGSDTGGHDDRALFSAKRVRIEDADVTLSDQFPTLAQAQQQGGRESRNSVTFNVGYISSDDENKVREAEAPDVKVQRIGSTRRARRIPVEAEDFQESIEDAGNIEAPADGQDCVDGRGALGDSGIISAATTMTIEESNRSCSRSPRVVMSTRSKRTEDMKELVFRTLPGGFTTVVLRFANRRSAALLMDCRAIFVRLDEFTASGSLVVSSTGRVASDIEDADDGTSVIEKRETSPASSPIKVYGSRKEADRNHLGEGDGRGSVKEDYAQAVFDVSPRRVNVVPGTETAFYVTFSPSDAKQGIYSGALKVKSGRKSYVILLRGEAFATRLFTSVLTSPSTATAPLSFSPTHESRQVGCKDEVKSTPPTKHVQSRTTAVTREELGTATSTLSPSVAVVATTCGSPYSVAVDHRSLRHKWLKEWVRKYKDEAAGHAGEDQAEGDLFVRNFAGVGSVVTVATSSPQLRVFCDGTEVSTFFLRSYGDQRLSVTFDESILLSPEREIRHGCAKTPIPPSTSRIEYLMLLCEDGEENIIEVRIRESRGESNTQPSAHCDVTPAPVVSYPRTAANIARPPVTSVLPKAPAPHPYPQHQPNANSIFSDLSAAADEDTDAATLRASAFYAVEVDIPAYLEADTNISLGSYSRQTQTHAFHESCRDFETQTMKLPRGRAVVATQTSDAAALYAAMASATDTDTSVSGDVIRRFASGSGAECDRSSLTTYRQQRQQQTSFAASESRSHKNGVYFRKSWIDFGNVTIGNMTRLKIELCNATEKAVTVFVGDPALPFVVLHNKVRLRPRSFVCLPVRFVPVVGPKSFSSEIFMQTDDGADYNGITPD